MELEFSFDANGRTTYDKSKIKGDGKRKSDGPHEATPNGGEVEYSCKSVMTSLQDCSNSLSAAEVEKQRRRLDELLFDCEIADCGLLPRTFWVPAAGSKPRCALEQMALDVFHHHVPPNYVYDPAKSGAEWWVQIRPSPSGMGRYAMHDPDPDDLSKAGISFHWDKDEELRLLMGGSMFVHPHISTVTYLTDLGAPTMVLNCRVNALTGEWLVPGVSDDDDDEIVGYVSWPKQGKHFSFDGRFLHAAPPDIMEPGQFEKQCEIPKETWRPQSGSDGSSRAEAETSFSKVMRRRHRRVTFLVNVWLNFKPLDVNEFPDTMIDKLSGAGHTVESWLFGTGESAACHSKPPVRTVTVSSNTNGEAQYTHFAWPLGGCGSYETIHAQLPLQDIRSESMSGGNVCIRWKTEDNPDGSIAGVSLIKGDPQLSEGPNPAMNRSVGDASLSEISCTGENEVMKRSGGYCGESGGPHKRPREANNDG